MNPIESQIHQLLQTLTPIHLLVENESHQHGGYFDGKESHFKVVIVSTSFQDKRLVARHQVIYGLLSELMTPGKIHALAIHAYTPDEWQGQNPTSPLCAHAPKHSA